MSLFHRHNVSAMQAASDYTGLSKALHSQDWTTRLQAATALAEMDPAPTDETTLALISALDDPEPSVRAAAQLAVIVRLLNVTKMSPEGIADDVPYSGRLQEPLPDKYERIRQLGELIRQGRLTPDCVPALAAACVMAAEIFRVEDLVPLLSPFDRDEVSRHLTAALRGDSIGPLRGHTLRPSARARLRAANFLAKLAGGGAIGPVGLIQREFASALTAALYDENLHVREGAADLLASLAGSGAVSSLAAALERDNKGGPFAELLVDKLDELNTPEARAALITTLKRHEDGDVRCRAAWALSKRRSRSACQAFYEALVGEPCDRYEGVRRAAATALGDISRPDPAWIKALLTTLQYDESSFVRASAAVSLANLGVREAFPVLAAVLNERNDNFGQKFVLYRAAAFALLAIDQSRAVPLLIDAVQSSPEPYSEAADECVKSLKTQAQDDRVLPALIAWLERHPHGSVREAAAVALGEIGDRRAVPALAAALDDSHWEFVSDPESNAGYRPVAYAAWHALELIGGPEAARAMDKWGEPPRGP